MSLYYFDGKCLYIISTMKCFYIISTINVQDDRYPDNEIH